ncbi:Bacteriophage replication gene A protein (GPA) [Collimonas sp. OK307]|uniref:replication endonuclease n=1 Tax=Collimonas sp. OK307 TaxID=1801620 RepID=UPI0008EFF87C|nr:replication endonuclease [Collimonas sp. OK307]SFH85499.1 Bacteriophage replication gene A protein (GPA) [Collimonas sp. OK307]
MENRFEALCASTESYSPFKTERARQEWAKLKQTWQIPERATPARIAPRPSMLGVSALLSKEMDAEQGRLTAAAYLSTLSAPFDLAERLAQRREELTDSIGGIGEYLHYSEHDIKALALRLAQEELAPVEKIEQAEKLLGTQIPGDTFNSQLARVWDARFWRRALRVRIMRAREHFFLRMQLIGKGRENYASDSTVRMRAAQMERQDAWMKDTVIVPRFYTPQMQKGERSFEALSLAKLAKGPKERFAKLYSFVKALDVLSMQAGLSASMLTLTLEAEWHPNPANGNNCWNGLAPRAGHQSFCDRWQAVLRDLHRVGIRMSGLRVAEPHQDSCPHYHIWALYRPEHERAILMTIMKYFPNKLKVRSPAGHEDDTAGDVMYDTRARLAVDESRPLTHAKEGAQVELSRIDRSISSGASYAMKYLLKTVDAGDELNLEAGLFVQDDVETQKKKEKHKQSAKRVDAFRSVWGINQGQLFGVAKCLTVWDELRALTTAPAHRFLKKLWELARGGKDEGRIEAGANIQGNAVGFLRMLGGLDAARNGKSKLGRRFALGRLVVEGINRYGDIIRKTKGVTLLMKKKVRVAIEIKGVGNNDAKTVMVWRIQTTLLASVKTRLNEWSMIKKSGAPLVMARMKKLFLQGLFEDIEKSEAESLVICIL